MVYDPSKGEKVKNENLLGQVEDRGTISVPGQRRSRELVGEELWCPSLGSLGREGPVVPRGVWGQGGDPGRRREDFRPGKS